MDTTLPKLNNLTPITGRMVNEEDEIHNVVDAYGSLKTIGIEHTAVHDGKSFIYTGVAQINSLATVYFLGRAGNVTAHLFDFFIKSDQAPMTISFFEAPTVTNAGSAQTAINRNRQSTRTATLAVFAGATVSADGTLLMTDKILGVQKDVTSDHLAGEWLLKKSIDYVFKITNNSNQAANIAVGFNWVEVD